MDKNEIYEMVIQEMMENALQKRRESCSEDEQKLYQEVGILSEKVRNVLTKLSLEDSQAVDDYITKTNLIAQHECEHLYVQGAKDCVEMLKKIGVL